MEDFEVPTSLTQSQLQAVSRLKEDQLHARIRDTLVRAFHSGEISQRNFDDLLDELHKHTVLEATYDIQAREVFYTQLTQEFLVV